MKDLNQQEALQFLQKHGSMVISTLSPDHKLSSAYVLYATNEKSELLFLTKKSTQKYLNIQSNKEVVFVISDEKNLLTLQGSGQASEITDQNENILAFDSLIKVITQKIDNWPPPAGQLPGHELAIIKIAPTWLRLRDYSNSNLVEL